MAIKKFEEYVAQADANSLAERLVLNHPKAAEDLLYALSVQLQDAEYGVWSEFAEEGLMEKGDAA